MTLELLNYLSTGQDFFAGCTFGQINTNVEFEPVCEEFETTVRQGRATKVGAIKLTKPPNALISTSCFDTVAPTMTGKVKCGGITRMAFEEASRVLALKRDTRAVMIIDIVESVRLIGQNEEAAVRDWLQMVEFIKQEVLPQNTGRMVKSTGDGLLADFPTTLSAVAAALAIQVENHKRIQSIPDDNKMQLRIGIEVGEFIIEDDDIYGQAVNMADRLMKLAGPGEVIASANARDQITPDLDADIEDLGDCYVKHVSKPIRAYRLGPVGPAPIIKPSISREKLAPTIAVLPFSSHSPLQGHHALGDILAEELIRTVSISQHMNVISRLSTAVFRGREVALDQIAEHLKANYVLTGSYFADGNKVRLFVELIDVKSAQAIWSERYIENIGSILGIDQELIAKIAIEIGKAVSSRELQQARTQPLPTIESYSLMISAITLMHRNSLEDFNVSLEMLQLVAERANRQAIPQAWIAKWYVLRLNQGWSDNRDRDSSLALDATKRALDADPDSSLALTVDGLVHTHMLKKHDIAMQRYELAVAANPNDSLAWLLKGAEHAFIGDGNLAVENTQKAIMLSPLDPHRYYYDTLAATAYLANHEFKLALEAAELSLRANKTHTSSLRAKAIACWQLGDQDGARAAGEALMDLEPDLTVSSWLARSPSSEHEIGREWSKILNKIGVPE